MSDDKPLAVTTIKVTKVDGTETVKTFAHRTLLGYKEKYITRMLNNRNTAYVDIMPREYANKKLQLEGALGGYNYYKAKKVLGLDGGKLSKEIEIYLLTSE